MIRIFSVPYLHRGELADIRYGLTSPEYVDKIWQMRDDAFGPVKKSRKKNWPIQRAPEPSANVLQLTWRKRA